MIKLRQELAGINNLVYSLGGMHFRRCLILCRDFNWTCWSWSSLHLLPWQRVLWSQSRIF